MDFDTTLGSLMKSDLAGTAKESASSPIGGRSKRSLDISIAAFAILMLSPLMIFVALLIWFHDRGRPIFGHTRVGCDGLPFKCLKFRSMVSNSADVLAELLEKDADAAREWGETQKLRRDPRITPIGRVLRLSSLDELPQLFNVLSGHMSIVGPRPIVTGEVERYGAEFRHYSSCRPGVTGLWQVSGRSDCSYIDRVRLDSSYATTWSFWKDISIILKTIPVVLQRKGSY